MVCSAGLQRKSIEPDQGGALHGKGGSTCGKSEFVAQLNEAEIRESKFVKTVKV
jgi:hypothetical protein